MKIKNTVLIIIAITLIVTLSACGITKDTSTVNDLGKGLMIAFRDGDYKSSWDTLSTSIQTEIGGYDKWSDYVYPRNFSNWDFTSTNIKSNYAKMGGEATLGPDQYTIVLIFEKIDEEWKISGINFTLKQ